MDLQQAFFESKLETDFVQGRRVMILPAKHISQDRALLTIGATILVKLGQPRTVSSIWEELLPGGEKVRPMTYDQFVLALDLLFLMNAIELSEGLLKRKAS